MLSFFELVILQIQDIVCISWCVSLPDTQLYMYPVVIASFVWRCVIFHSILVTVHYSFSSTENGITSNDTSLFPPFFFHTTALQSCGLALVMNHLQFEIQLYLFKESQQRDWSHREHVYNEYISNIVVFSSLFWNSLLAFSSGNMMVVDWAGNCYIHLASWS